MTEKLKDIKTLFQSYVEKYGGELYMIGDSILIIDCLNYMVVYEDDKRVGTVNNSTKIKGSIYALKKCDIEGEFFIQKKSGLLLRKIPEVMLNLKHIKEIDEFNVYTDNLEMLLIKMFQDIQYRQYLNSIELYPITLKEKTLQIELTTNANTRHLKLKVLENLIDELNQTYEVLEFYKRK